MTVSTEQHRMAHTQADREAEAAVEAVGSKWDSLVPRQESFPIPTSDRYTTPRIMDGNKPAATAAQLTEAEFDSAHQATRQDRATVQKVT